MTTPRTPKAIESLTRAELVTALQSMGAYNGMSKATVPQLRERLVDERAKRSVVTPVAKKAPAKKATPAKTTSKSKTPAKKATPSKSNPAAAAKLAAERNPGATDVEDLSSIDQAELLSRAKAEHAANKAAKKAGQKAGPTPYQSELQRRADEGIRGPKKASAKKASTRVVQTVRFSRDGKPMPDSQNKVASLAYQCTKNINGDAPRISTSDLVKILNDAGIVEITTTSWEHTLSNGVVLSAAPL